MFCILKELKMKYKITVRKPDLEDVGRDCVSFPDDYEYQIYLNAMLEDLNMSSPKISVERQGDYFILESGVYDENQILKSVEQVFSHYFCYVRYMSIQRM